MKLLIKKPWQTITQRMKASGLSYKALHGLQNNFWYFEKYECVRTSRTENAMFLTLKESRTLKEYEPNMNIQYLERTFKSVHVCLSVNPGKKNPKRGTITERVLRGKIQSDALRRLYMFLCFGIFLRAR